MGTRSALAVACAVAALLPGCGGSGQHEPSTYAFAPSRACLLHHPGVKVDRRHVDFVASTALGGAMRVRLPTGNFVHVSFGRDPAEAARIESAYRRFAGRPIPQDLLLRTKNVVLLWNGGPSPEERDTLLGCLKSSG